MYISIHAARKFLKRVIVKESYTCFKVDFAIKFLQKLLQGMVSTGVDVHFVISRFKNYKAVYYQNTIVTIISKERY